MKSQTKLEPGGSNLANVFATFSRADQAAVAAELCRLVPVIMDVNDRPTGDAGTQQLLFQDRWKPDVWYEPHEVSDGTILFLAFLVLQRQSPPVDVIAIEEPERGLHPYLLEQLVDMLRRLATGQIGPKPVQVLLATHSAQLLEFLRPEEVRFLSRDPADGSVKVEAAPTGSPDWEKAFREYSQSLGSAWLSGGLGGVPGS